MYSLADLGFKLVKTNVPLTELTSVISAFAGKYDEVEIQSQHVPFDGTYSYKRYNGMSIVSFDIDDAARRINSFLYG